MCGPPGFMDAVKDILKEMEFDIANLHLESFGGVRTSPKNKTTPQARTVASVTTVAAPPAEVAVLETYAITFAQSSVEVEGDTEMPLLDLAEENDVDLDYGCRSGSCGDCKVLLVKGTVDQMTDEGLEQDEIKAGYILTCVATPTSDCTLEA